jgi:hypothetical protein
MARRTVSIACDLALLAGACAITRGCYLAWPPLAWVLGGFFVCWAAFVCRGR